MIIESLVSGIGGLTGRFDPKLPERNFQSETMNWQFTLPTQYAGISAWAPMMSKLSGRTLLGKEGNKAKGYVGLAEMIQPHLAKMNQAADASSYEGILANSEAYRQAQRSMSPEFWGGLAQLLAGTEEDYANGYNLSPVERRNLLQQYRGAMAARGMGTAPTAAAGEAIALSQSGQGLRQQRLQNLASVLGMYGDKMGRVAAPGSQNINTAQGALGISMGSAIDPVQFANPNAIGRWEDVVDTNYNALAYEEIAKRNNRKEAWSNMGKVGDDILSMAAGGGMGGMMGSAMGGMSSGGSGGGGGLRWNPSAGAGWDY